MSCISYASQEKLYSWHRSTLLPSLASHLFLAGPTVRSPDPNAPGAAGSLPGVTRRGTKLRPKAVWESGGNPSTNSRELLSGIRSRMATYIFLSVGSASCPRLTSDDRPTPPVPDKSHKTVPFFFVFSPISLYQIAPVVVGSARWYGPCKVRSQHPQGFVRQNRQRENNSITLKL